MAVGDVVIDASGQMLREQWASSFAAQSLSDYCVFLRLRFLRITSDPTLEVCHELHYLQMACEKIAKAYRMRDAAVDIQKEMSGHVAFSQFIELYLVIAGYEQRKQYQKPYLFAGLRKRASRNAREIEKLAPSVDREGTPANAEYPWQEGPGIKIPCRYDYPNLHFLTAPKNREGVEFLQIVHNAIEGFTNKRIIQTAQGNIELQERPQK